VDNQRKRERKITEIAGIQGISRVRYGSYTGIISGKERYLNLRSR